MEDDEKANDATSYSNLSASLSNLYGTYGTLGAFNGSYSPYPTYIPTSSAAPTYSYSASFSTNTVQNSGLKVTGDADFDGDVKIKGHSILKTLEVIEQRLAILQPNPKKLEKFESLKKAYEHYKLLEALCSSDDDNDQ